VNLQLRIDADCLPAIGVIVGLDQGEVLIKGRDGEIIIEQCCPSCKSLRVRSDRERENKRERERDRGVNR
jgi:hypothetical protein